MLTLDTADNCTKSCMNCAHGQSWYHPQTYWEPADYGWECELHLDESIEDYPSGLDEEEIAQYYASKCGHHVWAEPARDIAPDEF